MHIKGSDGSGMGTEILNILGFGKYKNNGDESDTADNKSYKSSKSHSKFKKLKKLNKENKKSKDDKSSVAGKSIEIEIGLNNDNFEIVQAPEKSAVSSLVDVHSHFERQLEEFCNSTANIKEHINNTEGQLEKLYVSLEKLEKFVELCSVENTDVIKGLHKLVDVHKGAALLSTFSEDPTFKTNYEYNVKEESKNEIVERRLRNMRNARSMNNDNCEIPNENEGKEGNESKDNNEKSDKAEDKTIDNIIINDPYCNNESSRNKNELEHKLSGQNNASNSNSPGGNNREGKMSKTERFKEKFDNLRRKGRRKHSKDRSKSPQKEANNEMSNNDTNPNSVDNQNQI